MRQCDVVTSGMGWSWHLLCRITILHLLTVVQLYWSTINEGNMLDSFASSIPPPSQCKIMYQFSQLTLAQDLPEGMCTYVYLTMFCFIIGCWTWSQFSIGMHVLCTSLLPCILCPTYPSYKNNGNWFNYLYVCVVHTYRYTHTVYVWASIYVWMVQTLYVDVCTGTECSSCGVCEG